MSLQRLGKNLSQDDVKARHDKMVGLVETMMTADSLRLTAYGLRLTASAKRCE